MGSNPTPGAILRQAQDFMFYLYILLCDKAFFYVGITNDLDRRMKDHKAGRSPHTKRYDTVDLVYTETYPSRQAAEKREQQLKGWTRAKKKALIDGDIEQLKELSSGKS